MKHYIRGRVGFERLGMYLDIYLFYDSIMPSTYAVASAPDLFYWLCETTPIVRAEHAESRACQSP